METFASGFAYGITTVIIGQPLDTIKTRLQASSTSSANTSFSVTKEIVTKEGFAGLYRGGLPVLLGGGLMRSAQFGVYNNALAKLKSKFGDVTKKDKWFGWLDPHVIVAGFAGGIGRGVVESPVEFIKIRRQVEHQWNYSEVLKGFGATLTRNSFLFSSFVIYMDISKQVFDGGLGSFWTGALCASLAWTTVWPLDVAKSQLQSGNYEGKSFMYLLKDLFRSGLIFRGIVPGLTRSAIANGCSMVVYKKVESYFLERKQH